MSVSWAVPVVGSVYFDRHHAEYPRKSVNSSPSGSKRGDDGSGTGDWAKIFLGPPLAVETLPHAMLDDQRSLAGTQLRVELGRRQVSAGRREAALESHFSPALPKSTAEYDGNPPEQHDQHEWAQTQTGQQPEGQQHQPLNPFQQFGSPASGSHRVLDGAPKFFQRQTRRLHEDAAHEVDVLTVLTDVNVQTAPVAAVKRQLIRKAEDRDVWREIGARRFGLRRNTPPSRGNVGLLDFANGAVNRCERRGPVEK